MNKKYPRIAKLLQQAGLDADDAYEMLMHAAQGDALSFAFIRGVLSLRRANGHIVVRKYS